MKIERYDIKAHMVGPDPEWCMDENPQGDFFLAEDVLPYMVWQPIPQDLSELPVAEVTLKSKRFGWASTLTNEGGASLAYAIEHGGYTHWALAPVFKEEENA